MRNPDLVASGDLLQRLDARDLAPVLATPSLREAVGLLFAGWDEEHATVRRGYVGLLYRSGAVWAQVALPPGTAWETGGDERRRDLLGRMLGNGLVATDAMTMLLWGRSHITGTTLHQIAVDLGAHLLRTSVVDREAAALLVALEGDLAAVRTLRHVVARSLTPRV